MYKYDVLTYSDLEGEIWKEILNYPNYQVSNYGRIKSLPRSWDSKRCIVTIKGRILKQVKNSNGYLTVQLGGLSKPKLVHRIFAEVFIPNHNNKPVINHKNGIRHDNSIENLEWCTQQENIQDSYNKGRSKSPFAGRRGELSYVAKPVICLETNEQYSTAEEAAKQLKLQPSHIGAVCRGVRKSTGGLTFKFV